jgi:glucokinase
LQGRIVIIGPGTGLGVAMVNIHNSGYEVFPSEGGHVDYAPRDMLEMMLKLYIEQNQEGRRAVSEQAGSGVGLANIASFLAYGELPYDRMDSRVDIIRKNRLEFIKFAESIGLYDPSTSVVEPDIIKPQLIGRKLVEAYKNNLHKKILSIAMDIMIGADASAARDAVQSFLGYDGVIVVGGNARRLSKLFTEKFPTEFYRSASHRELIEKTPIYLLANETNKLIGSMGAAYYALNSNQHFDIIKI